MKFSKLSLICFLSFLVGLFFAFPFLTSANDTGFSLLDLDEKNNTSQLPGEVEYVGEERTEVVSIDILKYNESSLEQVQVSSAAEAKSLLEDGFVTWIDVSGVHDEVLIENFANEFGLSASVREDIANTTKSSHMEDYDNYIFWSIKMLNKDFQIDSAKLEQISLVLGSNYVISFQENNDNDFATITERLTNQQGSIRQMGADYLSFALTDVVVDSYFPAVNAINEQIDIIQSELIEEPDEDILKSIYTIEREVTVGRQLVVPMREIMHNFTNYDYALISPEAKDYFHIVFENADYLNGIVETFSSVTSDMVNYYISIYGHNTSSFLKFLTIFSTILLIMSFIAGIYGMNFSQFHPKQKIKKGHLFVLMLMLILGLSALLFFFWGGWL